MHVYIYIYSILIVDSIITMIISGIIMVILTSSITIVMFIDMITN